jgi:hypothetical protein
MTENRSKTGAKTTRRTAPKIPAPGRDTHGRFLKGATGNPGGRPIENSELKELARAQGPAAIVRLTQLMHSDDPMVCIAAARTLLDRGFGRAESMINLPNGGALVNVNMLAGSGPIRVTTAEEADAAYREIMGNSQFDFSRIEWAPEQLPAAVVRSAPPETQSKPVAIPTEDVQAPPAAESPIDGPDLTPTTPAPSSMAGQPPTPAEALAAQDAILRNQRPGWVAI